jgi:initiation factor 1A
MPPMNKKRLRAANKALAKAADDDLPDMDEHQQYAKVYKLEGDGKFIVLLNDGDMAAVHICGKMRRRVWVMKDDIVIVSLREGFAKEDHASYGKITKGDICGKIPTTMYGKLKKIEGFNLLKQFVTQDNGTVTLGSSAAAGGAGTGPTDALYEYVYEGEDEEEKDSGDESDVSHDSQKKEKRKKKGQALKFGITASEDSSKINDKIIDDI